MARHIVVLNPKGGAGKSTIASNLAAFYAAQGLNTVLMDFDAQASSSYWLSKRPERRPPIHGIEAFDVPSHTTRAFALRLPNDAERVVIDSPAAISKNQLKELVNCADRILIPVLPSDIDIDVATRFVEDLLQSRLVRREDEGVGLVANRVRRNTTIFRSLMGELSSLEVPLAAVLRDSQTYLRAQESGLGVHELVSHQARTDRGEWQSLVDWLERGSTLPRPRRSLRYPGLVSARPRLAV